MGTSDESNKKTGGKPGLAIYMIAMLSGSSFLSEQAAAALFDGKELFSATVIVVVSSPYITTMKTYDSTAKRFSSNDYGVILQAKDDALSFVASDGEVRGVYLESALDVLATHGMQQSDMELARFIAYVN